MGGSSIGGKFYIIGERNLKLICSIIERRDKTMIVKDELEITFNYKKSVDVPNLPHDTLVISLSIANYLKHITNPGQNAIIFFWHKIDLKTIIFT